MHGSMRRGLETEQTWPQALGWRNRPGNRRHMKAPGSTASEPPRQPPTLHREFVLTGAAAIESAPDLGRYGCSKSVSAQIKEHSRSEHYRLVEGTGSHRRRRGHRVARGAGAAAGADRQDRADRRLVEGAGHAAA